MIRKQSLDVLRGVAILLVLGRHFWYFSAWMRVGWVGVDLFFVLSGFLISGLLFREYQTTGSLDVRRFILRRGLKIWPAFYVFLIVMSLVTIRILPGGLTLREFAAAAFFMGNYFPPGPSVFYSHIWSLAVEEHFYLALPVLLVALAKFRRCADPFDCIPAISVGLGALCLAMRLAFVHDGAWAWTTHLRIDSLFAGVALGYLYHFKPEQFKAFTGQWSALIAALCVLPCALLPAENRFVQTFGLTFLLIGFSFLVANGLTQAPESRAAQLICATLARIGFYSYSIYLWHYPVGSLYNVTFHNGRLALPAFIVMTGVAIALGVGMSKLVEMPILRFREHWPLTAIPKPDAHFSASERISAGTVIGYAG